MRYGVLATVLQCWWSHALKTSCHVVAAAAAAEVRIPVSGNRTFLIAFDTIMTNQTQARAYCQQQGGDLLTITSQQDQDALRTTLAPYALYAFLWIGLQAPADADQFTATNYKWLSTGRAWQSVSNNNMWYFNSGRCVVYQAWGSGNWRSTQCLSWWGNYPACQLGEKGLNFEYNVSRVCKHGTPSASYCKQCSGCIRLQVPHPWVVDP